MNYFAHGMRFVDRPYFLAGTAVPDWLSVADRKVRMRARRVQPFLSGDDSVQAEVAAGVMQHLNDDQWFHETRAFVEINAELGRMFRELPGLNDGFRPGFLGHIVTEHNMARKETSRLAELIPRFHREQFLRDYLEPARLLYRLNQVMRRIKLQQLPQEAVEVISAGWAIVKQRAAELLPPGQFCIPNT